MISSDGRLMALSGAALYGSGGLLVLATLAFPAAPGTYVNGVLWVTAVAIATAIGLYLGRNHVPPWIFPPLTALGSILITLLTLFDGASTSGYALLYVWAALFAYYFYSSLMAAVEVAWIGALAAFELSAKGASGVPWANWLLIVGTVLIAGVLIQRLARKAQRLAEVDTLTGAANRRRLDEELPLEFTRASRRQEPLCVAILDLDHFKEYNDEVGHLSGDKHIRRTAEVWRGELRGGDLLVRYGGEEFAVILPGCPLKEGLEVVGRLRQMTPHGQTASAGIALWNGGESPGALLARADAALYEAKVAGRDRTVAAADDEAQGPDPGRPQRWATMLPRVLEGRQVRTAFQPIVRLIDGHAIAYEALSRPQGVELGGAVDGLFTAAQRMGLGKDLDWLCRRSAMEQAQDLPSRTLLFINIGVQALLSAAHDVDQMLLLAQYVERLPATVVLEITERESVSDLARLRQVLASYRDHGFRFSLDDVGEGHSTLEVLAAASPEYIKIARSLTSTADRAASEAAIAAVVAFARSSGSAVIAEGIENEDQANRMVEMGVELGQGYWYGRPAWSEDLVSVSLVSAEAV